MQIEISWREKLTVLMRALKQTPRLPAFGQKLAHLLCPVDSVRYTEFAYLFRQLRARDIRPCRILDVSSPFILAYIFSEAATVIKSDINMAEAKNIRESATLSFRQEDATRLTFADASFDLVYSISVIEHIHGDYGRAVGEMMRVLRPGGYLYLTFPVAADHREEWLDSPIYSHQFADNGRVFFQYRFSEEDVTTLLDGVDDGELVDLSIYWERHDGGFDRLMAHLQQPAPVKAVQELRNAALNLRAGFALLEEQPAGYGRAGSFGNASVLIRKRQ